MMPRLVLTMGTIPQRLFTLQNKTNCETFWSVVDFILFLSAKTSKKRSCRCVLRLTTGMHCAFIGKKVLESKESHYGSQGALFGL